MRSSSWLRAAVLTLIWSGVAPAAPPAGKGNVADVWSAVPVEPDSVETVNARLRQAIRPETNAAAMLVAILGEKEIPEPVRPEFLRQLGRDPQVAGGPVLQSVDAFAKSKSNGSDRVEKQIREALLVSLEKCERTFWRSFDHRELSDFLKVNDVALDRVCASANRPDYYCPLVSPSDPPTLINADDYLIFHLGWISRVLTARATLRGASRNTEGALADLLAVRRLALLVARNPPSMLTFVRAAMIDSHAERGEAALLGSDVLAPEQAKARGLELRQLPPPLLSADIFERERYVVDAVVSKFQDRIENGDPESAPTEGLKFLIERHRNKLPGMNWKVIRDHVQRQYSDFIRVVRLTDERQIEAEIARLEKEYKAWMKDQGQLTEDMVRASIERQDDVASLGFATEIGMGFRPDPLRYRRADARWRVRRDMSTIGFELARRHLQWGVYPASLDPLAADFDGKVPVDPFTGRPFTYMSTPPQGAVLYSWGENGKDDGGRSALEMSGADDVILRLP